jgi:N-acyl-D-amino-acid deacylase
VGHEHAVTGACRKYRREGVDVVVDQYPYDHSSTNLGITLPTWALADGDEAVRERLASAETRARIKGEMLERLLKNLGHADYSYAIVARYRPEASYEGKNISEVNVLMGRAKTIENEAETILDIMQKGGAQMVYHSMGNEDVERIMKYPNTAWPATAACACSARACRIRAATAPTRACSPSLCESAACSRSKTPSAA